MSFFNFKRKPKHISDGLSLKELKKQAKKDGESLIVPIEEAKKGVKFYKIGNAVYAPVPSKNEKKPSFFQVANITFVSQEDINGKAENRYNIAIQYKKNGGNYFYSYDLCDEKNKANICLNLTNFVNVQVRNKEDLKPKNSQKVLADKKPPVSDPVRRELIKNRTKHIDVKKSFTREETLAILRNVKEIAEQKKVVARPVVKHPIRNLQNQNSQTKLNTSKRQFFIDKSDGNKNLNVAENTKFSQQNNTKKIQQKIEIKDIFEPSRYDIPQKRYFEKIKFAPEHLEKINFSKLTQEEIDDILFFE